MRELAGRVAVGMCLVAAVDMCPVAEGVVACVFHDLFPVKKVRVRCFDRLGAD